MTEHQPEAPAPIDLEAPGDALAAEVAKLKSACRTLAKSVVGQLRAMEAARIELAQGDAKAGMQWILNSLPDVWDDPETEWDGKESANEWWDRTDAFYRAEREPAESPAPGPLILPPDEFRAVQVVAAVLGLPGAAPAPGGPGEAATGAFQARWPVTAGVLRSQVRAAVEYWASGDAGDTNPADVVMGVVAPFIESLVAEGLRAEKDRAESAEGKLAELRSVLREGGQDPGTVRRRALAIAMGTKIRERSDEKEPQA